MRFWKWLASEEGIAVKIALASFILMVVIVKELKAAGLSHRKIAVYLVISSATVSRLANRNAAA